MEFEEFVGLQHYQELLSDQIFWKALRNSLFHRHHRGGAVYDRTVHRTSAEQKFPRARRISQLVLIPWVVPGIAAAMTWKWMYASQYGIVNHILQLWA